MYIMYCIEHMIMYRIVVRIYHNITKVRLEPQSQNLIDIATSRLIRRKLTRQDSYVRIIRNTMSNAYNF